MSWPIDSGTLPTDMQGTTLVASVSDDHSLHHRTIGSVLNSVTSVFGTTGGTNLLRQAVNAGDQLFSLNSGGSANQAIQKGTLNNQVIGTPIITGGTGNGMVLGTPTIGSIIVPGTILALSFSAAIAPGVGTITDSPGGTLTVNAQQGQIFYSAMGTTAGNRTIGTPLNPTAYQQLTYAFKASGSANGTLVWATPFRFSQDTGTPTLGTGVTWNYYSWRYNNIDTKWDFLGMTKNLI